MRKPRHYWFYDQLYLFNFRLVWPVTNETLEQYLHDEFKEDWQSGPREPGAKALYVPNHGKLGSGTYIVALYHWSGNADDHSNLAHECVHIANMVLSDREVGCTMENDESVCYLSAYLLRQCLNVLLPQRLRVYFDPKAKPKRR